MVSMVEDQHCVDDDSGSDPSSRAAITIIA
jgi:hypothetical protein